MLPGPDSLSRSRSPRERLAPRTSFVEAVEDRRRCAARGLVPLFDRAVRDRPPRLGHQYLGGTRDAKAPRGARWLAPSAKRRRSRSKKAKRFVGVSRARVDDLGPADYQDPRALEVAGGKVTTGPGSRSSFPVEQRTLSWPSHPGTSGRRDGVVRLSVGLAVHSLLVLAGCGRFGFDALPGTSDATHPPPPTLAPARRSGRRALARYSGPVRHWASFRPIPRVPGAVCRRAPRAVGSRCLLAAVSCPAISIRIRC